jgi:hypothetical protein
VKKTTIAVIVLVLLSFLSIDTGGDDPPGGNWVIDGNKVYVNDSNAYLSAEPHTITSEGWVEFEVMRKVGPANFDIDLIWGFNTSEMQPTKPRYWSNYTHNLLGWHWVEHWSNLSLFYIISYNNLGIENYDNYTVDWGNKNNTKLYQVNYTDAVFGNSSAIIAFTSFDFDGTNGTISGNHDFWESYTYQDTFWDWKRMPSNWITVENYTYQGMNKWYMINFTSEKDVLYRFKAYIKLPFNGLNNVSGKYWWVIKPHDKTIQEAIADGQFYYLDPWYSQQYQYRKLITISSSLTNQSLINFTVRYYNSSDTDLASHAQDDGDDILFIDYYDNSTKLSHQLELFNGTSGEITAWIKTPYLYSSKDTKIWCYYGNSGASNQQDVEGTWDSYYELVQHLNETSGTHYDSTSNDNDGTPQNGVNQSATGKIDGADWFDGLNDYVSLSNISGNQGTISAWFKARSLTNYYVILSEGVTTPNTPFFFVGPSPSSDFEIRSWIGSADGVGITRSLNTDTWYYACAVSDGSTWKIYIDGKQEAISVLYGSNSGEWFDDLAGNTTSIGVIDRLTDVGYFHGLIDEVRVSNIERNASWINASYKNMNDTSFIVLGEEERGNRAPVQTGETPADDSGNIDITQATVNVTITDPDGNVFNWTIEGQYVNNNNGNNDTNGSKSATLITPLPTGTNITWYVNVSDGYTWTNATYNFTTKSNNPPTIPTIPTAPLNNSDYESVYNQYMNASVNDTDGGTLDVYFYWGNGTLIGTDLNVPVDTNASLFLPPPLTPDWLYHNTTYYWYVNVSDGIVNVTSPTWNFHTSMAWDINEDRNVTYLDASLFVADYGKTGYQNGELPEDIDNDGDVDYLDASLLIAHYGESY